MEIRYLELRKRLGLTQKEMANRLKMSLRTLIRREASGDIVPESDSVAHGFGVPNRSDTGDNAVFLTIGWWLANRKQPMHVYECSRPGKYDHEGELHPRKLFSIPPDTPIPVSIFVTQEYKDAAAKRYAEIGRAFQERLAWWEARGNTWKHD